MGVFYGVSTGPGDPELMTVKAVKIIKKCTVLFIPRTGGEKTLALSIAEKAVDISGKKIIPIDFPMSADKKLLDENYDNAAAVICRELAIADAAMLCSGDISVFSTFSYICEKVAEKGFETVLCPGVTSFCAASAALGRDLVRSDGSLEIIPFACRDFEKRLCSGGTKVIMKTGSRFAELLEILDRNGLTGRTSAVENCGLENEKLFPEISGHSGEFGYFTVFIVRQ